jgi:hypothetical protein
MPEAFPEPRLVASCTTYSQATTARRVGAVSDDRISSSSLRCDAAMWRPSADIAVALDHQRRWPSTLVKIDCSPHQPDEKRERVLVADLGILRDKPDKRADEFGEDTDEHSLHSYRL